MLRTKKDSRWLVATFIISGMIVYCSTGFAKLADSIRDKGVENNAEIRLLLKSGAPSESVDVHVNDKIIQIAGFVDNKEQYGNVNKVTAKYKNDYRIINNVEILSAKDSAHDDHNLQEKIADRLRQDKYPVESIDVQVRSGHVILSGFVNKHVSLRAIKSLTASVPGVTAVDNYLLYRQS